MKVMVISSSAPLGKGESFVVEEVNALADAGNDVVLVPTILRKGTPNQFKLGARVSLLSQPTLSWPVFYSFVIFALSKPAALFRLICLSRGTSHKNRWKNYFVIPKAAWVAKVLKSDPVDHIHAHWLTTPATLAMFVSDISGITWSATGHRGDIVANNLLDAKFKKAEFVRFISESGVRLARARATVNESKIHILHLGVKIPALDCAKNECAAKGGAKMNVLCPANLIAVKGHQILFQAVSVMRNKSLIDLTIAGGGELRHSLERLVNDLGISAQVTFAGHLAHSVLIERYRKGQVDIVVLPSQDLGGGVHEGIPVSLMEAMAYRIPVVSTNTGGIPELLKDELGQLAGGLIDPQDYEGLANLLDEFVESEEKCDHMGALGYQRVLSRFNQERTVKDLSHLMQRAIQPESRSQSWPVR